MKFKWWYGVLIFVLLLAVLVPLASASPDGLERIAEDKGFMGKALEPIIRIMPDYLIPGIANEILSTILVGIIGVLILFGIGYGLARLLSAKDET